MKSDAPFSWIHDPASGDLTITRTQLWQRICEEAAQALIPRRIRFWQPSLASEASQLKSLKERVGPMHGQLLDTLEKLLIASGNIPSATGTSEQLGKSELHKLVDAVERSTFAALSQARQATQVLSQSGGQLFVKTIYVGGDPSEWKEIDSPVDTSVALKACPGGPDYLNWAVDSAGSLRGRHASALRNLLERSEALLRHPNSQVDDALEDYWSEEINENGEWQAVFDKARWQVDRQARAIGPGRLEWERELHARALAAAAGNVRDAFTTRPSADQPWPWRAQDHDMSYRSNNGLNQPPWPFACELSPRERRDRTRLRREGDSRRQLGSILGSTFDCWFASSDAAAIAQWAIVEDAGRTLLTSGTVLRVIADALEPEERVKTRCAICGRYIGKSAQRGRMHCPLHATQSAASGKHNKERTVAHRLYGWGDRRRAAWQEMVTELKEDGTITGVFSELEAWWNYPERMASQKSFVDEDRVAELLGRLTAWTGEDAYHRLKILLPIWCRIAASTPKTRWSHPSTLFALHFGGAARIHPDLRKKHEVLWSQKTSANSGGILDPFVPIDSNHPLARGIHSFSSLPLNGASDCLWTDVLCDLLAQRSWIKCGGESMDKARKAAGSKSIPAPPPLERHGRIDAEFAFKLLAAGATKSAIAKELGVSRSAVTQFFDRQMTRSP